MLEDDKKQIKPYKKNNFEITSKELAKEIYQKKAAKNNLIIFGLSVFVIAGLVLLGYFCGPITALFVTFLMLGFGQIIDKLIFDHYHCKVVYYKNLFDGKGSDVIKKDTYKSIKSLMDH